MSNSPKYRVIMHYPDGTEEFLDDELYNSEEEAEDASLYGCSCYEQGGIELHYSNPGDYPMEEVGGQADYEIIEVE